jgi:uncharacterized OB-fold protein
MAKGPGVDTLILPVADEESAGFWEATARGELAMQTCQHCGLMRFPPRPMCARCRSTQRSWTVVSGRGEIWSFVVAHPPLLPAYAALAPYNVITVALEEDPTLRLVGNLVTAPGGSWGEIDPATIVIGEPVRAVFTERVSEDGTAVTVPEWVRI